MKWRLAFVGLLATYLLILPTFTGYLRERPVQVKLGYLPHPQLLKVVSGEHKGTVAGLSILRVLFYFGTIIQKLQENVIISPEYLEMFKSLRGALHLDPYNMDAYYFSQAIFVWDLGRVNEVNQLLTIGLESRTWDPWIPFYLGFNHAYFLKDYEQAAVYMQLAAELSGNPLFTTLAARYFYESEQTAFGLAFLETMIKGSKNPAMKKQYEMRRDALRAVIIIEEAIKKFAGQLGSPPTDLHQLVTSGILPVLPDDPYGGSFYLDALGRVRTTSKFSPVN